VKVKGETSRRLEDWKVRKRRETFTDRFILENVCFMLRLNFSEKCLIVIGPVGKG